MTYHTTAKGLAALGRNGDDTLMHVNKNELAGLQALLGPVSVNPDTGMPEAYSWSSLLGSVVGGLGSFGAGALLEPVVGDALSSIDDSLTKDVLKKLIPATVGAGVGAAVGGATGGKGGAMGGAAQGFLSGGLGAWGSEDVLGKSPEQAALGKAQDVIKKSDPTSIMEQPLSAAGEYTGYKAPEAGDKFTGLSKPTTSDFYKTPGAGLTDPTESAYAAVDKGIQSSGGAPEAGFFDKLGTNASRAYQNLSNKDNLKDVASDYGSYLFQAGLIGQGLADNYNAQDYAKKQREKYNQMIALQNLQAQQYANQLFAGVPQYYADGGPVTFSSQGLLPVQITVPDHVVEEAGRAGGIEGLMASRGSFANGGYINTQQVNPENFYPQSQMPKAQPYAAASPIRHEVINNFAEGGYIDGEGDGMSDDIDANIDGQEEVRVADGEFVVPKHIVDMIGVERLDDLLRQVRKASYGTDEQIEQDAGKLAAQRLLERYA